MRVILLQDIRNVGRRDEVKDVRPGFARNFLLPQHLAALATDDAVKKLEREQAQKEERAQALERTYKEAAEKLKNIALRFIMKMGEKGKAFGSVSAVKIHEALKKEGVEVKKDWIILEDSIKTTGEHQVEIRFPHGIKEKVKIIVEAE